jgi:hypothetical protein
MDWRDMVWRDTVWRDMVWPDTDWPATSVDVTRWLLVCAVAYIAARFAIVALRHQSMPREWTLAGDALMFGTSLLLLVGAWSPGTMKAIGDTSSFLVFSGLVGVQGTVRALAHG